MVDCYSGQEVLEEGNVNGIKFRVILHPKRRDWIQIVVKCPKCGKEGILNRITLKRRKIVFKVIHSRNPTRSCCFSWTSSGYEELKEIYSKSKYYRSAKKRK